MSHLVWGRSWVFKW